MSVAATLSMPTRARVTVNLPAHVAGALSMPRAIRVPLVEFIASGAPVGSFDLITEAGDTRITEAGDTRVTE